jgi:hypothetical protein
MQGKCQQWQLLAKGASGIFLMPRVDAPIQETVVCALAGQTTRSGP